MPDLAAGPPGGYRHHWSLDSEVTYLNHGSFGACPRAVVEHQAEWRRRMEHQPVDFFVRQMPEALNVARSAMGKFLKADPEGIAFVPNATTGMNAALRSWDLRSSDDVLVTDHGYPACNKALAFIAARRGARVVRAHIPFPLQESRELVEAVLQALTPRTRLVVLDHVSSPTALVFPLQPLITTLRARDIEVIVDGAHAPGMLPLDLEGIGAACYTGNAHKWLFAPKGAGFLYVRQDLRRRIRPLVVSHGYDPEAGELRFREEWDWTGTLDPTPWLSLPECLRFPARLVPGGWDELMQRTHRLALRGREILLEKLGVPEPCPGDMLGSMASVPLPEAEEGSPVARLDETELAAWTRERGIESWFYPWPSPGGKLVRISAQIYNEESEYHRLASILTEALRAG
jgi:isopenicillin-N epimerase